MSTGGFRSHLGLTVGHWHHVDGLEGPLPVPEKDKGVFALGMPDVVLLTVDLENSNCVCDQTIKVAGVNRLAIVSIPYLLAQRRVSSLPT